MTDRSLLIVRGGRNEPDPTFSCIAHSTDTGMYAAIEFENGLVTNRTLFRGSERKALEKMANSSTYTSVYADTRTGRHLLPFKYPKNSLGADLNVFRRAKSDEEISSIERMAGILDASRSHARHEQHFRGVVDSLNYRHAVAERTGTAFTLKRYGLQDELGRTVELSSVTPHTPGWEARMMRVNNGCRAVEQQLREGVTGVDIDKTFRSHLDPRADVVYGRVVHHTGYQPWESDLEVDVVRKYDVLTICPIVGDRHGNTVPYMHSVRAMTDDKFRGAADPSSFKTLFHRVSNSPIYRGEFNNDEFKKNVEMVMATYWGIKQRNDKSTKNILQQLDGGFDKFVADFLKVIVDYEQHVVLMLYMLEDLRDIKWQNGGIKAAYGVLLEPDLLRYIKKLLYFLVLKCKDLTVKSKLGELNDTQRFLLTMGIAFVSALTVTDPVDTADLLVLVTELKVPDNVQPTLSPDMMPAGKSAWSSLLIEIWNRFIRDEVDTLPDVGFPIEFNQEFEERVKRALLSLDSGWDVPVKDNDWTPENQERFEGHMKRVLDGIVKREYIKPKLFTECLHATAHDLTNMLAGRTSLGETWRKATDGEDTGIGVSRQVDIGSFAQLLAENARDDGTSRLTFEQLFERAPGILKQRVSDVPDDAGAGKIISVKTDDGVTYVSDDSQSEHNISTSLEFVESICTQKLEAIGPEPLKIVTPPVTFTMEEEDAERYEGLPVAEDTSNPDDAYKTFRDAIRVPGTEVTVLEHKSTSSEIYVEIPSSMNKDEVIADYSERLKEWKRGPPIVVNRTEEVTIIKFNCSHPRMKMVVPQHVTLQGTRDYVEKLRTKMKTGFSGLEGLTTDERVSLTQRICIHVKDETTNSLIGFVEGGPRLMMAQEDMDLRMTTFREFATRINEFYVQLKSIIGGEVTGRNAEIQLCNGSFKMFVIRRITYYLALYDNTDIVRIARVLHVRFRTAYEKIMEHQEDNNVDQLLQEIGFTENDPDGVRDRVLRHVGGGGKLENTRRIAREIEKAKIRREDEVEQLIQREIKVEDQTEEMAALRRRLETLLLEQGEMEERHLQNMQQSQADHMRALDALRSRLGELEGANRELVDTLQRREGEHVLESSTAVAEKERQLRQEFQAAMEDMQGKHAKEAENMTSEIELLKGNLRQSEARLAQQLEEHTAQLRQVASESNNDLMSRLAEAEAQNANLRLHVPEVMGEVRRREEFIDWLRTKLRNANDQGQALETQLTHVRNELRTTRQLLRDAQTAAPAMMHPPPPQPPAVVVVANNNKNRPDSLYAQNYPVDPRMTI